MKPAVVVGYDGSPSAAQAVRFAAADAVRRDCPLRIVHVRNSVEDNRVSADLLAAAFGIAREHCDEERIAALDPSGAPGEELVSQSQGAELLVIGRGSAQRFGSALDSIAIELMTYAHCSVVAVAAGDGAVVDPADVAGAPTGVVVGVKHLDRAEAVLAAAFTEAELRACGVVAVHAWRHPEPSEHGDILPSVYDPVLCAEALMERLRDTMQPLADKYPDIPVTIATPRAGASEALAVAARNAPLLVVGASHRGPVRTAFLGSNGQDLMREVRCPVFFVRPRHAR